MKTKYLFGKDFTYSLYAYDDSEAISDLPSQTVTAYVFSTRPDRTAASAGTGALKTATQSLPENGSISLTIPAISDPEPTSDTDYQEYYISINFVLKTGADTQTVIRELPMRRVSGQDSNIGITVSDIEGIWPDVLKYVSSEEVTAAIDLARSEIVSDLENRGVEWASIHSPKELRQATLFNSLFYVLGGQGDDFATMRDKMESAYKNTISALKLSYDPFRQGSPITKESVSGSVMVIR